MSTVTALVDDVPSSAERIVWINGRTAVDLAGISYDRLRKLAAGGHIRRRMIPGAYPRYAMADVQRLAIPA